MATSTGANNPADPSTWNRYSYVAADPVNREDRHGTSWDWAGDRLMADHWGFGGGWGGGGGFPCNVAGWAPGASCALQIPIFALEPPPTDPCDGLGALMNHLANAIRPHGSNAFKGLNQRIAQMAQMSRSNPAWTGHLQQIDSRRNELRRIYDQWNNNNCGDPPAGVMGALHDPVLSYDDRREIERQTQLQLMVVGYILYRVVRLAPSILFPPLWPTVPGNVAIP